MTAGTSNGFGHESPVRGATDDWLTPPYIIDALGPFDLDPCASEHQPWRTATKQYTINDDGLAQLWEGFVWCNPPYGTATWDWLRKMDAHANGIALTFARTETRGFFETVWRAKNRSHLLFIEGRVRFHRPDGTRAQSAGAPSVLIGYGDDAADRLAAALEIKGALV